MLKSRTIFLKLAISLFAILLLSLCNKINSQECPVNIDFENGTFENWTCWTGNVINLGTKNVLSLTADNGPKDNRQTIISRANSIGVNDQFGGFPIVSPNGSNYCVKLGNTDGGHEAEGISYDIKVPANKSTFSIVYYYAVVFSNPDHEIYQQPRFVIEVKNLTDNKIINCPSATFIPFGSTIPGFSVSPIADSILYKAWTPVTVNLNGNAGKTIRVTFKTADCTFFGHFGYAYIDIDSDCGDEVKGSVYCKDDSTVTINGPYGFAQYNWYDQNFTKLLGTQQTISFKPIPLAGTKLALELIPYNGYGCPDTTFITLSDTLDLQANAGPDLLLCGENATATLGVNAQPGINYQWSPPLGLSNTTIANPSILPAASSTSYILTVTNSGGGCKTSDTVIVKRSIVDTTMARLGQEIYCASSGKATVLSVNKDNTIQWYINGNLLNGATGSNFNVAQSGIYEARLINKDGCTDNSRQETINIIESPPGITYPLAFALLNQPLQLNSRDFGGTSQWNPGTHLDNINSKNPVFLSSQEGDISYKISITTSDGCLLTDYQPVKSIKEVKIFVPNIFTPNNDGINDFFRPVTFGATITEFKIYNRYGQEIFSLEQNNKGWDGTFKGQAIDKGVYAWYIKGTGIDKNNYSQKGTVLLIR